MWWQENMFQVNPVKRKTEEIMSDYIVRAMAGDGQIRAFAATTREMVETAKTNHSLSPVVTAALGRLLTAGAMMGITLKGEKDLLTLQVKGEGPVKGLTVTADSKGNVKGYAVVPVVNLPPSPLGKLDVGAAIGPGVLHVLKDLGMKEPYSGQTVLQTSEIAEDLTYYFAVSEQVPTSVGLGVLMNRDNTVKEAGGFIIQLMPFASDEVIDKLEENLQKVASVTSILEAGHNPKEMLEILLEGLNPEIQETIPCQFFCNCTKERVEKAIISIGKKDIVSMIEEGKDIEVNCHFCNKNYQFTTDELNILLQKSKR